MPEYTGSPSARGRRFGVIVSRFNEAITTKLLAGTMDALKRHGVAPDDIDVVWVPGAWELPSAARRLLGTERYDALVAGGAVVPGGTPHRGTPGAHVARESRGARRAARRSHDELAAGAHRGHRAQRAASRGRGAPARGDAATCRHPRSHPAGGALWQSRQRALRQRRFGWSCSPDGSTLAASGQHRTYHLVPRPP